MNINDQFTRQAQDMFNAAKDARIPENVQHMAEEGVVKTREAYQKMNAVTKDGVKVMEDVLLTAHAGAKTLGEKVLNNTMANTEAAFDAAQAIARARSIPEAAKLQADFMQQQFAICRRPDEGVLRADAEGCPPDVRDHERCCDQELRAGQEDGLIEQSTFC